MEERIKCTRCDRMILPITAKTNSGLCGHCRKIARREEFDAIVASWERDPAKIPGTNGIPEPIDIALAVRALQMREAHSEASRIEKVFPKSDIRDMGARAKKPNQPPEPTSGLAPGRGSA